MPELDLGKVIGPQGPQGAVGPRGIQGVPGIQGPAGQSAYEAAVAGGYTGTLEDFSAEIAGLPGLYERFNDAGQAKDAAALGGVSANGVLKAASLSLYISASGSDTQGDGSEASPFKTVARALQNIRYQQNVALYLSGDLEEAVSINNICLTISIIGSPSAALSRLVISNIARAYVSDITVSNAEAASDLISVSNVKSFEGRNLTCVGSQNAGGITLNNSIGYMVGFSVTNCLRAVSAIYNSYLTISGITGSGNSYVISSHSSLVNTAPVSDSVGTTLYERRNMGVIFKDNYPLGSLIENPPLASGWKYSSSTADVISKVVRSGNVVTGILAVENTAETTETAVICTLPAGYRPVTRYLYYAYRTSSAFCPVRIDPNGAVRALTALPSGTYLNIIFSMAAG